MNPPATGIPVYAPDTPATGAEGKWSSGLCGCCSDIPLCCLTCWCPCIAFGRIAEIVDKGTSSCGLSGALYALFMALGYCPWIYSCTYRTKIKQQYGIPANACCDCCVHFCCECCALAQEYRELRHRGLEPSLGWQGNLIRQNQGVNTTTVPVAPDRMHR